MNGLHGGCLKIPAEEQPWGLPNRMIRKAQVPGHNRVHAPPRDDPFDTWAMGGVCFKQRGTTGGTRILRKGADYSRLHQTIRNAIGCLTYVHYREVKSVRRCEEKTCNAKIISSCLKGSDESTILTGAFLSRFRNILKPDFPLRDFSHFCRLGLAVGSG